jgi:hypothetical protein
MATTSFGASAVDLHHFRVSHDDAERHIAKNLYTHFVFSLRAPVHRWHRFC